MMNDRLRGILEAVLFVSGEAFSEDDLASALDMPRKSVEEALYELEMEYQQDQRGFSLKRYNHFVQLTSKADYAEFVERVLQPVQKQTLSQSALETLAIVAYRQPVTRQEVEAIRV